MNGFRQDQPTLLLSNFLFLYINGLLPSKPKRCTAAWPCLMALRESQHCKSLVPQTVVGLSALCGCFPLEMPQLQLRPPPPPPPGRAAIQRGPVIPKPTSFEDMAHSSGGGGGSSQAASERMANVMVNVPPSGLAAEPFLKSLEVCLYLHQPPHMHPIFSLCFDLEATQHEFLFF